jgi:hypothetical protein
VDRPDRAPQEGRDVEVELRPRRCAGEKLVFDAIGRRIDEVGPRPRYAASCSITSLCLVNDICSVSFANTPLTTTAIDLICRLAATRRSRATSNRRLRARSSRFRASVGCTTVTRGSRDRVASVFRHHSVKRFAEPSMLSTRTEARVIDSLNRCETEWDRAFVPPGRDRVALAAPPASRACRHCAPPALMSTPSWRDLQVLSARIHRADLANPGGDPFPDPSVDAVGPQDHIGIGPGERAASSSTSRTLVVNPSGVIGF